MSSTERLTSYRVLYQPDGGTEWSDMGTFDGRSAEAAIAASLSEEDAFADTSVIHSGAKWVAVPARSWRPIHVTAKRTVSFDLKPATDKS